MKQIVKKGATSNLFCIFIQDSSSTTGAGLTGLTSGSSGLVCYRARADDGNAGGTAISLSAGTKGTWSSGGFVEKDATNMPGVYELGVPDAVFATGSNYGIVMLKGATNMAPVVMEFELTALDLQTAIATPLTAAQIATGVWQDTTAGDFTTALSIGKSVMNGVSLGTGLTVNALTTNNDKAGYGLSSAAVTAIWQDATAGDFTAANSIGKSIMNGVSLGTGLTIVSVSGSVGSVTGAVGSVTGAVGSVTGLTASNLDATISSRATPAQILTTALTESYAGQGVVPTLAQILFETRALQAEKAVAGTTLTAKKIDGSTTAATYTLNDATAPTAITRAT